MFGGVEDDTTTGWSSTLEVGSWKLEDGCGARGEGRGEARRGERDERREREKVE
jgi:hypothetical protein